MFHHFPDELGTADYLVRATHFGLRRKPHQHRDDQRGPIAVICDRTTADIRSDRCPRSNSNTARLSFETTSARSTATAWRTCQSVSPVRYTSGWTWMAKGFQGSLPNRAVAGSTKPIWEMLALVRWKPSRAKPSLAALNSGQQLMDLAGDGQLDLVTLGGSAPGFYERTHDRSWAGHRAFDFVPSVTWDDPNLRFVDLTGDGHVDVMVTEDRVFTWYPSLAEEGYAASRRTPQSDDDETGPRLVFADASQSIYLADMSGDGLTDLVRIRNGEVCYWPNLGYGNFGSKVTMDNAPWFDAPGSLRPEAHSSRRHRWLGHYRHPLPRASSGCGLLQPGGKRLGGRPADRPCPERG